MQICRSGYPLGDASPPMNREIRIECELTFFAGALWYGDETKGLVRIRPSV
jgi:hypothetical protein